MLSRLAITRVSAVVFALAAFSARAEEPVMATRIVAIGGAVTEIIYALGEEERLIGRDSTSVYPAEALKLPDTGYIRALSPEGVLSLYPNLILALEGAGPPDALATLKSAGVRIAEVPEGFDQAAIGRKIEAVGAALGVEDKAKELAADVNAALDEAVSASAVQENKARVLFVLSTRNDRIMAAGSNSHADGIVTMAGGENVMASISGYKQVTNEAVIEAAPDLILMMNGRGDHAASDEEVLAHPALAATPAGKAGRIVRMDGSYLLGFGPRTADAILDLHKNLYPQSTSEGSN